MSTEDDAQDVVNVLDEGSSTARTTSVKPVLDETWAQVEELPEDNDSDFEDEEVCQQTRIVVQAVLISTESRLNM
jgi:hypothetical protein